MNEVSIEKLKEIMLKLDNLADDNEELFDDVLDIQKDVAFLIGALGGDL